MRGQNKDMTNFSLISLLLYATAASAFMSQEGWGGGEGGALGSGQDLVEVGSLGSRASFFLHWCLSTACSVHICSAYLLIRGHTAHMQ